MNTYWQNGGTAPHILNSALDRVGWLASRAPAALPPGKSPRPPVTIGQDSGWV